MTGPANVEVIVEHMLHYLRSLQTSDALAHGRADLASRLVELAERYAPNNQWFIQVGESSVARPLFVMAAHRFASQLLFCCSSWLGP